MNLSGKDFKVSLDLGSSSFKMVQLARKGKEEQLIRAHSIPLARGVEATQEEKSEALKKLLEGVNFKQTHFIVTFNSPRFVLRIVTLPVMPKRELRDAILLEAKSYFPFPIEGAEIDFEIIQEFREKDVRKLLVAVASVPRDVLTELLALLKNAGIRPLSVVPCGWALFKLAGLASRGEDAVEGFLEMGERFTEFLILRGKQPVFSRKIPVAGSDFTRALTEVLVSERGKLSLTSAEAESLKRRIGYPLPEQELTEERISRIQMAALLRAPMETLTSEIGRSLEYFREENAGTRPEEIFLLGGASLLKGLPDFLSQELGLKVKVGNPLEWCRLEAQLVLPEGGLAPFACAFGAALCGGTGLNLLPVTVKKEIEAQWKRVLIETVLASALCLLSFFYVGLKIQSGNFQKRIDVAHLQLSSLQSDVHGSVEKSLMSKILSEEPYWEDVFREISLHIPAQMYLTNLQLSGKSIILTGKNLSEDRRQALSQFTNRLENGIFKDVRLTDSGKQLPEDDFQLSLETE